MSIPTITNMFKHFILWYFFFEISLILLSFNISTVTRANSLRDSVTVGNCVSYDDKVQSFCVYFEDCPRMFQLAKSPGKTKEEWRLLQKMTCGFSSDEPLICCPYYDILLKTNFSPDELETPPPMILYPTPEPNYGQSNDNTGPRSPHLATTTKAASTTQEYPEHAKPNISVKDHPNFHLLPPLKECGVGFGLSDRIIGGNDSLRGSHPWIVRIGFTSLETDEIDFGCAGTIISSRYILTAAHCVKERPNWKLTTIRVGEHNTETLEDCEDKNYTQLPCSTFVDYDIEKSIAHSNYKAISNRRNDDIALIRVKKEIIFTSCIVSPVCLPFWESYGLGTTYSSMNVTQFDNKMGTVCGWGVSNSETDMLDILQEIAIPIVPNRDCQKKFDQTSIKAVISPKQMCVGGVVGKSACRGDSGGPVTLPIRFGMKMFQLGIVSFGLRTCSREGVPTVFTRISAYTQWILDNIRP